MTRRKATKRLSFEESVAHEVYECYRDYAVKTNTLPNPHVFWEKILVPSLGYQMPWGSMQYHWQRLQIKKSPATNQPYIVIDEHTKAVRVPELNLGLKIPAA